MLSRCENNLRRFVVKAYKKPRTEAISVKNLLKKWKEANAGT